MAETLIDVINDVLIATHQRANKTVIALTDSTAYMRDQINEALRQIYKLQPFVVDADGTVTITPSNRTFAGPTDTELQNIHAWSLRINDPDGDIPVQLVTEQYIIENFPRFETEEADKPRFIYFANGLLAIYPLLSAGASNLTLQFKYSTQFTKLTSPAATFPFKDQTDELQFCRLYAQYEYESLKGLGIAEKTGQKMETVKSVIVTKIMKAKRVGFTSNRRYGR